MGPSNDKSAVWYEKGLPFKCTGCGKCCTGVSGCVWVNEEEVKSICEHLDVPFEDFCRDYLDIVDGRWSLKEIKITKDCYDCIFLNEKKCMIYSVRPVQCRTYPWWPMNLESEQRWQETAKECEGINPSAPVVPFEKIQESLQKLCEARNQDIKRGIP